MQKGMQTVQRFSIRKYAVGTASVLLGAMIMTAGVSADEMSGVGEDTITPKVELTTDATTESSALETAIDITLPETTELAPKIDTEVTSEESITVFISPEVEPKLSTNDVIVKSQLQKRTAPAIAPKNNNISENIIRDSFMARTTTVSNSAGVTDVGLIGDDYPAHLKHVQPETVIDPWRLYARECVSFVAHRLSKVNGFTIPGAYGNANEWAPRARREGYIVNKTPEVGSVAYWSYGTYGHVAWVAAVSGDSVTIEEYNFKIKHSYSYRTLKISEVESFIHFKDVSSGVKVNPQPTATSVNKFGLAPSGTYHFTQKAIVRNAAKQSSPEVATYMAGQSVYYDKVVEEDGYRWISYISYSGSRRYIAIEALAGAKITLPAKGVYTFIKSSPVKNEARARSATVATYDKGEKVNYDKVLISEGKQWISYLSYSGVRRFVQVD